MNTKELLQHAIKIAKIGGEHTLSYFRKNVVVERKGDQSPVTIADRETEQVMRDEIKRRFPNHGIIGEEFEAENPESEIQWILDPIDGTKSFIHGIPLYTTLIGITIRGVPKVGVINAPAMNEICAAAIGEGVSLNGKPCHVSSEQDLSKCSLMTTDLKSHHRNGYGSALTNLIQDVRIHRTWGDAYGHMMVATGRADAMIDAVLNVWDAAAILPVIKEAGGVYSDLQGLESIESGSGISANPHLHKQILTYYQNRSDA
jgi:histidinol phosphatase-like enzyme (inositol monophosphatase family)